eukprot:763751-Hanusia_phi.AAC.5
METMKKSAEDGVSYNALVDQAYLDSMKRQEQLKPWNIVRYMTASLLAAALVIGMLFVVFEERESKLGASALISEGKNPYFQKELKALLHEKMERELRYLKEAALTTAKEIAEDKQAEEKKARLEEVAHKKALRASEKSERWLRSHSTRKSTSKLTPEEQVERVLLRSKERLHHPPAKANLAHNSSVALANVTAQVQVSQALKGRHVSNKTKG